ncbi:MAG TPA: DUF4173 domain-containing protein [Chloroflexia bacterium]|jgi:hypothetical protein
MTRLKSPVRVLLAALALGWVTDLLFYGNRLGVSVPIFLLFLLGALFMLGRVESVQLKHRNLWLLAPLVFFAAMVAVRANEMLTFANVTAVIVLLALLAFFYAADHIERLGMLGYPVVVGLAIGRMLTRPAPEVSTVAQSASAHKAQLRRVAPILRGIVIALPVLIIFTALLSSADTVFAGYLGDVFKLDLFNNMPEMLLRQVFILMATWVIAGVYFLALTRRTPENADEPDKLPGSLNPGSLFGFVEGAVVLALVNLLFIVFAWIQFTQLFSGEAARTMHFEVFREYVRRGFGELLVVSILTMLLILGLRWMAWKETAREIRIFNGLSTLMIILAVVMLVSAFLRMIVWEGIDFYIYTQLRLYIRVFIVWLGVLFAWLLYTLWLKPNRFAIGAFVVALGFLVTINYMNPDADVAAYNLKRNDELSVRYLHLLSDDAVPALVAGLNSTTGDVRERLRAHLGERLQIMDYDRNLDRWPSFHLSHWQAQEMLNKLHAAGVIKRPGEIAQLLRPEYAAQLRQWNYTTGRMRRPDYGIGYYAR